MLNKIKSFFEKHPEEEEAIETLEEIMDKREERGDEVLIADDEVLLMKNLFHLRDIRAEDILIPRTEVTAISVTASLTDLKKIILRDKFTRIPVYEKTLDNIVGVLHTKDLLCALLQKKEIEIGALMHKNVLFVPTSVHVLNLLREMQSKSMQLCVVVDEFGGTAGLITLEDLLEEIVGEIEDEHDALDTPPAIRRISPTVVEADAQVKLANLEKNIGHFLTQKDKEANLDTVGGLVFYTAGRLPARGEIITHASGIKFQVMELASRRIKKLRISHFLVKKVSAPKGKKHK